MKNKIIILLLLMSWSVFSGAASFNCGLNSLNNTEKLVCKSPRISILDEKLADSYSRLKSAFEKTNQNFPKKTQIEWIKESRQCNQDFFPEPCLFEKYQDRVRILNGWYHALKGNTSRCLGYKEPFGFYSCYYGAAASEAEYSAIIFPLLKEFDYGLDPKYFEFTQYINQTCGLPVGSDAEVYEALKCYVEAKNKLQRIISNRAYENSLSGIYNSITSLSNYLLELSDPSDLKKHVTKLLELDDGGVCSGLIPEINSMKLVDSSLLGKNIYYVNYYCSGHTAVSFVRVTSEYTELVGLARYRYCYRDCDGFEKISLYVNDVNGDGLPDILLVDAETGIVSNVLGRSTIDNRMYSWEPRFQNFPEEYGYNDSNLPLITLSVFKLARKSMVWPFIARNGEHDMVRVINE
jgi:uncharacterized protein YecT (DUF1311 family)